MMKMAMVMVLLQGEFQTTRRDRGTSSFSMVVMAADPSSHEPEPSDMTLPHPRSDSASSSSSTSKGSSNTRTTSQSAGRHDDPPHSNNNDYKSHQYDKDKAEDGGKENNNVCGIWLAPSTIPGSGMGMFAGKDFAVDDSLGNTGDAVIPVVDFNLHQGTLDERGWTFLWDDYTWDAVYLQLDHEGMNEVNVCSPGFGSAANCFLDLQNVEEWYPENHNVLDRRYDPGAGGFSSYHNRLSTAKKAIRAGEELFVSYGDNWFLTREYMGPIPISGDLERANQLFQQYKDLKVHHSVPDRVWKDLWVELITKTNWTDSRVLGSFTKNNPETELDELFRNYESLTHLRRTQATRDLKWIQEHGVCCDNMEEGLSTQIQAGRGAFSTRFLAKGSVVAPLPMIHIPYDRRLNMYATTKDSDGRTALEKPKRLVGKQVLLNYCYGHKESTMLLCPYGMFVSLVNHNQTLANVRLQWADPAKSSLNISLLQQSVDFIDQKQTSAALAMDLVAIRDIKPGEEIFLDYGDAWEAEWQRHLAAWKPFRYSSPAAGQWNAQKNSVLRTEFEQMAEPYPGNIELKCSKGFRSDRQHQWQPLVDLGLTDQLERFGREEGLVLGSCELLRRKQHDNPHGYLYTAVLTRMKESDGGEEVAGERIELMEDVPREAFHFVDRPYHSDMFLPDAFRHAIMIPDDIFPEAWKNRKPGSENDEDEDQDSKQ